MQIFMYPSLNNINVNVSTIDRSDLHVRRTQQTTIRHFQ